MSMSLSRRLMISGGILAATAAMGGVLLHDEPSDLEIARNLDFEIFPTDPLQTFLSHGPVERLLPIGTSELSFSFSLSAVVLGARHYRRGASGRAMPVDLALGWGPMSNPSRVRDVNVKQRMRFYFYEVPIGSRIAPHEAQRYSANMHLIPGDRAIEEQLLDVRRGDLIHLGGYLADVYLPDRTIRTSRTRMDTGAGACEIVHVERLAFGPVVPSWVRKWDDVALFGNKQFAG